MMEPTVKMVTGYQPVMPTYQGQLSGAGGRGARRVHQVAPNAELETVQAIEGRSTNDRSRSASH